jgi:replicative superfamily II helicase
VDLEGELKKMVDFRKKSGSKVTQNIIDPMKLYNSLDRKSDKGPLRPVQRTLLTEWHQNRRSERDIILKLHTGQGKTLLGLLMLQSKLNEGAGPALYLCPNHFLVEQTVDQARQFGIRCVMTEDDLPAEFTESRAILVAVVHKLFNGLTKFKLGASSFPIGALLLDDAHACIDAMKDEFIITLRKREPLESNAHSEILALFENDLRDQGDGTFEDISRGVYSAYLPVPYWAWWDKTSAVAKILSRHASTTAVKFAWPLLRDSLRHTFCLVSGTQVVIAPYLPPLEQFGSYANARHRIFMSATVTDDSFLVKGLGLSATTIQKPLLDPDETWSGEKMVLIPSLIDDELSRENVVARFAKESARPFGIVVLVPSSARCADWEGYGARIVDRRSIGDAVQDLRNGSYNKTVVVANYYDGIDLPDDTCRILIIDSKPFAEDVLEKYVEDRRPGSKLVAGRIARIVEQGMGRAVRGEKDYCAIILIGSDLICALQAPGQRDYFSDQTRTQIQLGKTIAEFAKEEIENGKDPMTALVGLIQQGLRRDPGWKDWYIEQMDAMESRGKPTRDDLLKIFQAELGAEQEFHSQQYDRAAQGIQKLIDEHKPTEAETGWYLQEMARYSYPLSKAQSNERQRAAHNKNRSLLRPKEGMIFSRVATLTPAKRIERIKEWLTSRQVFENVATEIDAILTHLSFGVIADRFEKALQELACALGFESDRPDNDWKQGPDNLWGLRENHYIFFECKSEVEPTRAEIHKDETDQMNRSSAWFKRYYEGADVTRVLIIPPRKLAASAAFNDVVLIMEKKNLDRLTKNVRGFFNEFRNIDLRDISEKKIEEDLQVYDLTVESLTTKYCRTPVAPKA